MKLVLITIVTALVLQINGIASTKLSEADKILGVFWSPKKDAKIEIYKRGAYYYGKSVWLASPRKDTNNPNAALQNRELLGIELLANFSYKNGEYTNGSIYDPESGKTYQCTMRLSGAQLKVRGYIGISLFGRTEIFVRVGN